MPPGRLGLKGVFPVLLVYREQHQRTVDLPVRIVGNFQIRLGGAPFEVNGRGTADLTGRAENRLEVGLGFEGNVGVLRRNAEVDSAPMRSGQVVLVMPDVHA